MIIAELRVPPKYLYTQVHDGLNKYRNREKELSMRRFDKNGQKYDNFNIIVT